MIVCKFGGSSTATKQAVENVKKLKSDNRVVWVFSAIGKENKSDVKTTDLLISYTKQKANKVNIKHQIIKKFEKLCRYTNIKLNIPQIITTYCKEYEKTGDKDWFISRGEFLTTQIMALYLNIKFIPAEQVLFLENNKLNLTKTEKAIKRSVLKYKQIAIPGFYALNNIHNNENKQSSIKLFSRGGSDYSACVLAKCLGASMCENWTDVDGIYPINPKLQKSKVLQQISYMDLDTMVKMDAKVIHKNCAELLNGSGTILQVRNILNLNNVGTLVSSTYPYHTEFLSYLKRKSNCVLVQGLKNGGKIKLTLPISDFQKGFKYLQKTKKQL